MKLIFSDLTRGHPRTPSVTVAISPSDGAGLGVRQAVSGAAAHVSLDQNGARLLRHRPLMPRNVGSQIGTGRVKFHDLWSGGVAIRPFSQQNS